jgi:excisionase family DNA binding protein
VKFWKATEVAPYLGIDLKTAYRWAKEGRFDGKALPFVRVRGLLRFRPTNKS